MFLEAETRRGYYISSDMKKVWLVELELLQKLLDVCKRHNLRIWAEGGTLLGAVREHGFIPWDDDIDMVMLREDYDKLQIVANEEFKAPYFYQTGFSDFFPNGMAKLRKDGSAAIEHKHIFKNQHQGIFIDIFPLDAIPKDGTVLNDYLNRVSILRKNLYTYCDDHIYSLTNWKYNLNLFKVVFSIWIRGFHNTFKEYERFVTKYNGNSSYNISLVSWGYNERYVRNPNWYNGTLWLPFEMIELPIPIGYHEILTKQFDDYMTPHQIPSVHGGFEVLSADTSYLFYLPLLRKKYLRERKRIRRANIFKALGIG